MRQTKNRSRKFRQAAPVLAGACVSLLLADAARAAATLWTTEGDFNQWTSLSGWTVAGDTTFDIDGSDANGLGNSSAAGAIGTPGSLQMNPPAVNSSYTNPSASPDISANGAALAAIDPGSTPVSYPAPNFTQVLGSTVPFYGTLQMTYTIPDNNSGGGGYIEMGVVLNYDGNYGQYFPSVFGSKVTVDGLTTNTVQIPYVVNAEPSALNYFQLLTLWNSDYAPTLPVYVDNIGVLATPLEWNNGNGATGDGVTWDTLNNQNWSDTVAESQGGPPLPAVYSDNSTVAFDDNNNGNYNVTLNTNVSPNSVTFNNNNGNYVLSGTGGIVGTTSMAVVGSDSVSISTSNSYTGVTSISSGTLVLNGPHALPTGGAVVNNGTLDVEANTVAGNISGTGALVVGLTTPAVLQLSPSSGASTVGSLQITAGSSLDLTNNSLTVNYGSGADPLSTVQSYLTAGFNSGWKAGGIYSSAVASLNASQSALIYSVGYADGSDGITSIPSGQIEILPTLAGDAKMQGNVVFGDFQLLSQYFGQSNTTWDEGNFTYGSTTNFGDFQLLSQNFGASSVNLTSSELASINSFAAQFGEKIGPDGTLVSVPEPASAGILAITGISLLARRRSNRRG